ncbi:flavin-binding monooxygenase [Dictyobacter vulcani]|uniref:Flavin-binding monooxygenase n=1 Tax=Dictyobacter vulcani TaxID=2607529 RepID=A0A5J4KIS2_9CHLR|nr:NAD(P)/FAD-dependent oxidoreductase [Dictyobacter vulcani]GER86109.1 flavin-binding monooxygenase [Dictyobacter vulcani]
MFKVFAGKDASEQHGDAYHDEDLSERQHVHIAILGTGFAGLGMAIRLKQKGYKNFVLLERASDIGGTWRDNTYPGCACDIPSHLYSFSFALNPQWSRTYSPQSEIQSYLRRCARRFGIIPHIRWNSELQNATWQEDEQCWRITTSRDILLADILILGNGPLSQPSLPQIPGLTEFEGTLFHSAQWKHEYDLTGKRVAVIGTGASAIQFVPHIQPVVNSLTLFLRTPPWILPRLDHAITDRQKRLYQFLPISQRLIRTRMYWERELTALGMVYRSNMLKKAEKIAERHLERQVPDATLREKLTPHYAMGCKRILLSDDFYPAISQPNVEVVSQRIRQVKGKNIITEDGQSHEVDTIICGTGFHVTDTELPHHIYGRNGQTLADKWQDGPEAYYGTTITGFPNLFLLIGPNTGLGHNSMVYMIESQLSYILDCLRIMHKRDIQSVEVKPTVEANFIQEMQQRMKGTVWASGCVSWYLDARGHNTTLWPGFTFEYRHRTRRFNTQHYTLLASEKKKSPVQVSSPGK